MILEGRPETRQAMCDILDTMAGSDGGEGFIALRTLVEEFDLKAAAGDSSAVQIIDIVIRFSRLIDVAKHESKRP